ncbi:MAG: hypothetical protein KF874_13110 [Rhizobiaceae bacterium]|nr:hypothetical protein [Rhizobiaceae bacterium]
METYSISQDFFQTYRSSSDFIKALWVIAPPLYVLGQSWVILNAPCWWARSGPSRNRFLALRTMLQRRRTSGKAT